MSVSRWALYDLSFNSPSFDIFTFIQYAYNYKAEGIWFKPGYRKSPHFLGEQGERQRMKTMVIPAVEMHGFRWGLGEDAPSEIVWPIPDPNRHPGKPPNHQQHAHKISRMAEIKELAPITIPAESLDRVNDKFKGRKPIVVITRKLHYEEHRNSSPDWERWASDHDAEVIGDYHENQISLNDRMAHYALSSLCFGVDSGNMGINHFSKRPYLSLKLRSNAAALKKVGIVEPFQYPWADKTQKLVWNDSDTYEEIEFQHKKYLDENR